MTELSSIKSKKLAIIYSIFSVMVITFTMIQFNYVSRENDTRLYSRFVKQLTDRPIFEIISPKWVGETPYAEVETPYVRDHLPGQFILPVLIAKMGFPKAHSLYFVNIVTRLLSLWLFLYIGLLFLPINKAVFIPILIQLIPINLTYQLRANHEHPLLLFVLIGIIGCLEFKSKKTTSWLLISISVIGAFFIKGLAFIPVVTAIGLYLIINFNSRRMNISICILILLFLVLISYLFEQLFFSATNGVSFFSKYIEEQIYSRSIKSSSVFSIGEKMKSSGYYISRLIAYAAPFNIFLIVNLFRKKEKGIKRFFTEVVSNPITLITLMYLVFFSFSSRLASRYLYPAYFTLALYSIIEILKVASFKIKNVNIAYLAITLIFTITAVVNIIGSSENHLKYIH